MQIRFDALIVGAGPAGSSAAIRLAMAGWSVGLVEQHDYPRRKVCGECVAASNFPLLDALGVGSSFQAQAGPPLHRVALMRARATVEADLPPAAHPHHAWGRALSREVLDTLLLDRARKVGVVVLQPWAVQQIGGTLGAHHCTVREGGSNRVERLQARVAILANGSWEPLPAERTARRVTRRAGDLLAFKAHFQGGALSAGILPVLAFNGGYGGMVQADQGLLSVACCIRADRLWQLRQAAPGKSAGDVVEAMLRSECHGVARALEGAHRKGAWIGSGPLATGVHLRSDDPVFRIGNAAGEAHPIIGEGMSMALQSAWLLCEQLVRARPADGIGAAGTWQRGVHEHYAAQWRRHFLPRMRLAAAFAHLAMKPATAAALVQLLRHWPALLTRGAVWGGKVRSIQGYP